MGKKKRHDSSSSDSSSSESNSDSDGSSVEEKKSKNRQSSESEESENSKKQKEPKLDKPSKEEANEIIKKHKLDDAQKSKWDSPAENISKNIDRKEKDTKRRYSDRDDSREPRKHLERPKQERRDEYRKHDEERRHRDEGRDEERRHREEGRDEERRHRDEGRDDERRHRDEGRDEERRYRDDGREEERRHKDDVKDDDRRYKDRHPKERGGRYDRRQNEDRYRNERRRSRERSHSRDREDNRRDKREDFRRNKRSKFNNSEENENYEWGRKKNDEERKPPGDKEKPNFGLSGKLTEDTNTYRGIVIKYSEPPEARKPKRRWRLYPFKGEKALPTLYIHRESAYLMGRERKVVDFPLDHPSCSKQHAVLQYRLVPFTRDNGTVGKRVRPYLIDLDSANGTYINNKRIEARKYYELLEKDVVKFGYSTREYVLLHENSKDEGLDDDVKVEDDEVVPVKEEPQE